METLANRQADVSLRIVDIESWDSAVARQYSVRQLPSLWLYRDGALVTRDTRATIDHLNRMR